MAALTMESARAVAGFRRCERGPVWAAIPTRQATSPDAPVRALRLFHDNLVVRCADAARKLARFTAQDRPIHAPPISTRMAFAKFCGHQMSSRFRRVRCSCR